MPPCHLIKKFIAYYAKIMAISCMFLEGLAKILLKKFIAYYAKIMARSCMFLEGLAKIFLRPHIRSWKKMKDLVQEGSSRYMGCLNYLICFEINKGRLQQSEDLQTFPSDGGDVSDLCERSVTCQKECMPRRMLNLGKKKHGLVG
jgi:hypothetical protein